MNLSDYLKDTVINHNLRGQVWTPPSTLYLALFTAAPSAAGGGTEVSGGGYARQVLALDAAFPSGITQNSVDILFPTPTGAWGTITHGAVFDALTLGNLLLYGSIVQAKLVQAGGSFKVLDGDFDFSLN